MIIFFNRVVEAVRRARCGVAWGCALLDRPTRIVCPAMQAGPKKC